MWGRAVHGVDRLDRGASAWFSCVEPIGSVTGVRNRRPVQGWLAEPIASVGGARPLSGARGWLSGWVDSLFWLVD
jgi:hypothetical protein